jgi:hypothetical protein
MLEKVRKSLRDMVASVAAITLHHPQLKGVVYDAIAPLKSRYQNHPHKNISIGEEK